MITKGKVNVTMDGQFGSTGKGLLNSFIAEKYGSDINICISNAAPNAGHTYVDEEGNKKTTFHLPVAGAILKETTIYLCAGAIIDPLLLDKELETFGVDPKRVYIHPRACILLPSHAEEEHKTSSGATKLASTQKGVGAALADKIARKDGARTALQYYGNNSKFGGIGKIDVMRSLDSGLTALLEIPQGFGLSINHGLSYPHCTSRDLTVMQGLNDAGIHPKYLGQVSVSLRTYPIRVGNIVDADGNIIGFSGPFYPDSKETTFEELGQPVELTTVTKRPRRIATFSQHQYWDMLRMNRPDNVFLNFCNYMTHNQLMELLTDMAETENEAMVYPARYFGSGPANSDVTYNMRDVKTK